MGGAIAQEIAIQAPRAGAHAHARGHVRPPAAPTRAGSADVWSARVSADQPRAARRRADAAEPLRGLLRPPEMVEFIRTAMLNNPHPQPPEAFARQLARVAPATTPATGSARSRMPTHVIGGEYDILVPVWKATGDRVPDPGREAHGPAGRAPRALGRARRRVQRGSCSTSSGRRPLRLRRSDHRHRGVHVLADGRGAVELDDLEHARDRPARRRDDAPAAGGGCPPGARGRTASRRRSSP